MVPPPRHSLRTTSIVRLPWYIPIASTRDGDARLRRIDEIGSALGVRSGGVVTEMGAVALAIQYEQEGEGDMCEE